MDNNLSFIDFIKYCGVTGLDWHYKNKVINVRKIYDKFYCLHDDLLIGVFSSSRISDHRDWVAKVGSLTNTFFFAENALKFIVAVSTNEK